MRIVLASGSPRRRDLLASTGIGFEVVVPDVDESMLPGESPTAYVERVARRKALAVDEPGAVVIAADTTVVHRGRVLGKPAHPSEAVSMLAALAGESHTVMTGLAVRAGDEIRSVVGHTRVSCVSLTHSEITAYVATGEPMDKAGAYALQGLGAVFVDSVDGSPSNVVGLPMAPLAQLLRSFGVDLLDSR